MCMQGFDSKRVLVVLIIASPFLVVGYGVAMAGKGIVKVVSSATTGGGKRERIKAKISHLKERLNPDETEVQLKQLKKSQEEHPGTEQAAYFGLQIAVVHCFARNDADQARYQLDETIQFLEGLKNDNRITYKGHKTLLFAYYLAASIASDHHKNDEALKNFDGAVQQWVILDSTPENQKTAWAVHAFERRDFHKPRKCAVCDKILFGKSRHGLECKVCECIVHPKCVVDVVTPCKFDANNNETTGFESMASANVTLPTLLNSRGLAYYYAGHYDKALNDFDAVIDTVKKNPHTNAEEEVNLGMYFANRALVYFYTKNLKAAIDDTTTALAHGFVNAQVYTIRASALQLSGKIEEALEDRKKARECDPSAPLEVFPYELPMELIITVFSFLPAKDLARAARSCKLWNQIINQHTNLGWMSQYPDMRRISI
mmetsp:Transcript_492/g.698  ORF Transcript_492/g.698 Transcript_492/m.698 type:complete len:430 (+) Transcript_492:140-1429(+)|eukprot:CAMPEP_0168557750 /NCGR_PEP_ID=MMETSP0413-20121227/9595_1 /TAXON_ID=136452 /ORGANISM="Filamoeba nolandi, Strain NC-AS-23-1" /LENGTH=429 /DNA_ID=CAMNT_0008588809 /DNA_START=62 /DNA_END=1351 /DNA_ORIENTATION=-